MLLLLLLLMLLPLHGSLARDCVESGRGELTCALTQITGKADGGGNGCCSLSGGQDSKAPSSRCGPDGCSLKARPAHADKATGLIPSAIPVEPMKSVTAPAPTQSGPH